MKDIQGVQRGKCNTCECEEYRTSPKPQPGQLRCEYCNHTPGEHVKIIELGACSSCGKEECDKYQSEDPNSYTDCAYCGCPAHTHAGADKRKSRIFVTSIRLAFLHVQLANVVLCFTRSTQASSSATRCVHDVWSGDVSGPRHLRVPTKI